MFTFLDRFLPTVHEKRMTALVMTVILLIGISLTSRLNSEKQNLQQRASTAITPLNKTTSDDPNTTATITQPPSVVTPDPLSTPLNLTITLNSIKTPVTTSRIFTIKSYDASNNFISSESSPLTFQNGAYTGIINMTNLQTGSYTFTISTPGYLTKLRTTSPRNLIKGTQLTFPGLTLTAGDINLDGILNTLDYTILSSCLDEAQKPSCTSNEKESSDLNGDNLVDQLDYDILLSNLK